MEWLLWAGGLIWPANRDARLAHVEREVATLNKRVAELEAFRKLVR